jgi:hypothetical protein
MQEQGCCLFISLTHYAVLHGIPPPAFKKQNFTVNVIHCMDIISITDSIKEEINNIFICSLVVTTSTVVGLRQVVIAESRVQQWNCFSQKHHLILGRHE